MPANPPFTAEELLCNVRAYDRLGKLHLPHNISVMTFLRPRSAMEHGVFLTAVNRSIYQILSDRGFATVHIGAFKDALAVALFNEPTPVGFLAEPVKDCANVHYVLERDKPLNFQPGNFPRKKGLSTLEPLSLSPYPGGFGTMLCDGPTVKTMNWAGYCFGNTKHFDYKMQYYMQFRRIHQNIVSTFAWLLLFDLHNVDSITKNLDMVKQNENFFRSFFRNILTTDDTFVIFTSDHGP